MDNRNDSNINEERTTPDEQIIQHGTEQPQPTHDDQIQFHNMSLPNLPHTAIPVKKKKSSVAVIMAGISCFLLVLLAATLIYSSNSENKYTAKIDALNATIEGLNGRLSRYEETGSPYTELESEYEQLQEDYLALTSEYEDYKLETADYMSLSEIERSAFIVAAKEQVKAEEEARKAEEALGYETGITYKEIARNPDDYRGKKVKFTGYVKQILDGYIYNEMRMSTSGKYDEIIYATYRPSLVDGRLLEDDHITICGTVSGLKSYTAVLGNTITLPEISIDQIEILDD